MNLVFDWWLKVDSENDVSREAFPVRSDAEDGLTPTQLEAAAPLRSWRNAHSAVGTHHTRNQGRKSYDALTVCLKPNIDQKIAHKKKLDFRKLWRLEVTYQPLLKS